MEDPICDGYWSGREILSRKQVFFSPSIVKKKMNSESYSFVTAAEVHRLLTTECLVDFVTRDHQSESPTMNMRFPSVCMRNLLLSSWYVACRTTKTEEESPYGTRLWYGKLMVLAGQESAINGWSSTFRSGMRVDGHKHAVTRWLLGPRCCLTRKVN